MTILAPAASASVMAASTLLARAKNVGDGEAPEPLAFRGHRGILRKGLARVKTKLRARGLEERDLAGLVVRRQTQAVPIEPHGAHQVFDS